MRKPDIGLLAAISFVLLLIAVIILFTEIMVINTNITNTIWDIFLVITIVIAMYCLLRVMDDIQLADPEKKEPIE